MPNTMDEDVLEEIKKAVSNLPEEERKTVEIIAESIRKTIEITDLGPIALALVGAEFAAKGD